MRFRLLSLGAVLVVAVTTPVLTQNLAADLQRAKQREIASGDCKSVLADYMRIAEQAAKTDRASAAEALLRAAMCHAQLGDGADQKLYARIAGEFSDVGTAAAEATRRLRKPASPTSQRPQGPSRNLEWTLDRGRFLYGGISPDGRYLPFAAKFQGVDQLFLRDLLTATDRQVTSIPPGGLGAFPYDSAAAFSRDGRMLAFGWDQAGNRFPYRQEVRILDLQAGTAAPRTVFTAEPREMLFPHDWTPDGKSIAMEILSAESLKVGMLSVESGSFRVLRTMLPNTRAGNGASMFISPVGRYVAFDFLTAGKPGRDIVVVDVAAGAEVATITHAADDALMGWTSDGDNILFASDRSGTWTIWSAAFRPGSALAEPRPVARDINPVDVALGVTASGEIWSLKKAPSNSSEVKVSSIDFATGQVLVPPTDIATEYLGTNSNPVWSPDGNYLAYISIRGTYYVPRIVLVIRSLTSNDVQEVRPALTNVGPSPNPPQALWTPDGRSIILLGAGSAGEGFYTVDVRTGATTFIVGGTIGGGSTNALRLPFGPKSLSPDGQRLYYRRGRGAQAAGGSIIERELISGTERTICSGAEGDLSQDGVLLYCFRTPYGSDQQVIVETNLSSGATRDILAPATARRVWVSPDGQSLLVAGENVGNVAVAHILSLRTGAPPVEITKQLVRFILWAPDSRAVVLGEGGEVWWTPTDGRPRRLLDALQFAGLQGVDLHPDGRRVARVYSAPRGLDEVWVLRGVLPAVKGGRP